MWEIADGELAEMRALLTRPTSKNLAELVTRLEALGGQVAKMEAHTSRRGSLDPGLADNLRGLQDEMSRIQRLLSSAATFYNGIASLRVASSVGYQRTGLLQTAASDGRLLAQL